ncbi:MAG: helix-turn-helix domain-containing protein [Thermoguttaceae bacterium]
MLRTKTWHTSSAQTTRGAGAPEREHIVGALRETGWVVGGPKLAATRLGMKRSTLYKKMKKLGIFVLRSAPQALDSLTVRM